MNELRIFNNEEFGEVRVLEKDGEPWFVAKDICESLSLSDTSKALTRLDQDEKDTNSILTPGGNQIMLLVNEYGLYNLVLASRKPSARKFKRWVTHEVLPSIRQNGGYIANQENLTPEQIVANALVVAQNIINQKDKFITEMQPKVEYFDELVERNLLTSFRDTSKELHIKEKDFINFLLSSRYVYRDSKGKLQAYAEYTESGKGLFDKKEYINERHQGTQTMITPKGRETFRLLIKGI